MSTSSPDYEELFEIDDDTAEYLWDLDDQSLRSFAARKDSYLDDEQCKASSYACFLLFKRTRSVNDLWGGINLVNLWLRRIPNGRPEKKCPGRILPMLSAQLEKKNFHDSLLAIINGQQFNFLDMQFGCLIETGSFYPEDAVVQGAIFNNAGVELSREFEATDSLIDLSNAILFLEKAVALASDDHTRAGRKHNLATLYGARFERTGCTKDLDIAIELTKEAIATESRDHPDLVYYLSGLQVWMSRKFERYGKDKDLEEAVDAAEMAIALTADDDPYLLGRLNDLANRLNARCKVTGDEDDLIRHIQLMQKALNGPVAPTASQKALFLGNLGQGHYEMFRKRNSVDDLIRSLQFYSESVKLAFQENHKELPSLLNNISLAYHAHFEQFGVLEYLDNAIYYAGAAVDETAPDHPDIIQRWKNLGTWLCSRSMYTGSLDDIDRSIAVSRSAIERLHPGHPDIGNHLSGLGGSLHRRFDRTWSVSDLEESLKFQRQAIECNTNPSLQTLILNNYANVLAQHGLITDDTDSVSKGIEHMRTVLRESPCDDAYRPSRVCNLGNWLCHRFRSTSLKEDIDEAISLTQEACDMLPPQHLDKAGYLQNLGSCYIARFEQYGDEQDQLHALSSYKMGSEMATATPSARIELAFRAAEIHADRNEWKESSKLMESAIDLFPTVSLRLLKHTDKQDMLGRFFGLASDAAAISLNAGNEPYHALQLLERGRGVIAGLLMDMRGDISDLETKHPDLAQKFRALRDQLTVPSDQWNFSASNDTIVSYDARVRQRRAADHDFNDLISKIREETDLHNFLLLPSEQELIDAAKSGPIVIINTSLYRCDAFLIQGDKIRVQRLTDLTLEDLLKHVRVLQSSASRTDGAMKALLHWLWDTIMSPCLDALGFVKPSSDETLPRIWWVPTGLLSRLPLHAAGDYREQAFDSVLDRVMSSYALSVKALIHGRQAAVAQSSEHSDRAILIPMKQTPGLDFDGHLPFAEDEVDMLKDMCKPLGLQPVTPEPRKDDVLECVKSCTIFHFAGHGSSDPVEASKSCLLLDDWKTNPLTVEDFRDYHIGENPPFLGYLSACSTGANTVTKLADEGIHLISSLQLAGFQHVVGTLWEVSDKYCVDVARVFYKTLQEEGLADTSICRALHKATKALRDGQISAEMKTRYAVCVDFNEPIKVLDNFHWVPYIHFGC
ncbi:unnamed protein product [Fusarium graminearum]|nr:unnamed protein product [Fusarium graminearum]